MRSKYKYRGFSLIELLTVIAIILIMTALMLPAISGFSSTAGRRGAVNVLMNSFEGARVSALKGGSKVYVVMRCNQSPGERDSFCIMQEHSDLTDDSTGPAYVPLVRWQKLPNNVLFYQAVGSLTATGNTLSPGLIDCLPGNSSGSIPANELFALAFNRSGQIVFPAGVDLNLFLAEASRSAASTVLHGASATITERLSFRRYTGRAQLDYTAPQS